MENWDDLRFVVALARYGSMAGAARHLHTNTATVSRRIKRLNETSGITLFVKGATQWELTTEGRRIYDLAETFSEKLQKVTSEQHNSSDQKRLVKISAIEYLVTYLLAPALGEIHDAFPNLSVEISANEKRVSLAYGEADIALRLQRPTEGRLIAKRLTQVPIGVFGPPSSSKSAWIGLPHSLDWTPEMRSATEFFGCEPKFRLASFQSILSAMKTTNLPGVCPNFLIKGAPQFQLLQPERDVCKREIWLLIHESKKNDQAVRDTCSWIEKTIVNI